MDMIVFGWWLWNVMSLEVLESVWEEMKVGEIMLDVFIGDIYEIKKKELWENEEDLVKMNE